MDSDNGACPDCRTPYGKRRRCYKCNRSGSPKAGETRQCGTCGKSFYVARWKLNDVERNQGAYCSRECKHQAQMEAPVAHSGANVPEGSIQCTRCGIVKSVDQFGADKRKRNGKKSACDDCAREAVWAWRLKYPERYEALKGTPKTERQKRRRRDRDLQKTYGLTLLDYARVLESQNGGCAICGSPASGNGRAGASLHIDHDHSCCPGKASCGTCVRGLLCSSCNTMIGLAKDDPERLLSAVSYLRQEK